MTISRNYPFNENYTHVLGYVSPASEQDILTNEIIKENMYQDLKLEKLG